MTRGLNQQARWCERPTPGHAVRPLNGSRDKSYHQCASYITPKGARTKKKTSCIGNFVKIQGWYNPPSHELQIEVNSLVSKSGLLGEFL